MFFTTYATLLTAMLEVNDISHTYLIQCFAVATLIQSHGLMVRQVELCDDKHVKCNILCSIYTQLQV